MGKTVYLLDSSSFITPFNSYYSLEYVPGFWEALLREHDEKNVFTINAVKNEILTKEDDLKQWFESPDFPKSFFLKEDEQTIEVYKSIISWTNNHQTFSPANKAKFAKGADGYLVAYAKVHGMTVVTEERHISDPKTTKIQIPNVCEQFGVPYIRVVEMTKALNVVLVLEGQKRSGRLNFEE